MKNLFQKYDDRKEEMKNLKNSAFIKDFNLLINQCYIILWKVENVHKIKTKSLQTQKGKIMFHENAQCVIVKDQDLSKSQKIVDY